ncbi:MAG: hypothetical protein Q8O94_03585 [bacterium]|nr:hypothetical protein [bacterium]
MTVNNSTNRYATSNFIVAPTIAEGANYTTIASALAAAPANSTVFIKPGVYTEDLTLKASVNLAAFAGDEQTPNVTIVGKCTATFAGTCSISNIRLQTNSDFFLVVSGSSATRVLLTGCYLNIVNNTGISLTSSSSSSEISLFECDGNIGTTGITMFAISGAGVLAVNHSSIINKGASTTASTLSAGTFGVISSYIGFPVTTSGATAKVPVNNTVWQTGGINTTALTHDSTAAGTALINSHVASGTASVVSVGAGATMSIDNTALISSNASTVAGTGTVRGNSSSYLTTLTYAAGITVTKGTLLPGAISFNKGVTKLDTYATGTWTPTVDASGGGMTGQAYTTQRGTYTRIGNIVHVFCDVTYTAGATGAGGLRVLGLPYTIKNLSSYNPRGPLSLGDIDWPAGYTSLDCYGDVNNTRVRMGCSGDNVVRSVISPDLGGAIEFSLTYEV